MEVNSAEGYLKEMGINVNDQFTKEQAIEMVNAHVISIYKGRVKLIEDKEFFTGSDIADKLFTIKKEFKDAFDNAVKKELEDEIESLELSLKADDFTSGRRKVLERNLKDLKAELKEMQG